MIRVTLKDQEQTISFLTTADTARRLVAGCAANPDGAGELLRATEIFQRGIAVALMSSLMDFDKALEQHGPTRARQSLDAASRSDALVWNAFQVVDAETESLAASPAPGGLLLLDLQHHAIAANGDFQLEVEGEILAHDGEELTDREITYVLPKAWSVNTS